MLLTPLKMDKSVYLLMILLVLPSPNILSTPVASFLGFSSPDPSKLSADRLVSAPFTRTASPLTDLLSIGCSVHLYSLHLHRFLGFSLDGLLRNYSSIKIECLPSTFRSVEHPYLEIACVDKDNVRPINLLFRLIHEMAVSWNSYPPFVSWSAGRWKYLSFVPTSSDVRSVPFFPGAVN